MHRNNSKTLPKKLTIVVKLYAFHSGNIQNWHFHPFRFVPNVWITRKAAKNQHAQRLNQNIHERSDVYGNGYIVWYVPNGRAISVCRQWVKRDRCICELRARWGIVLLRSHQFEIFRTHPSCVLYGVCHAICEGWSAFKISSEHHHIGVRSSPILNGNVPVRLVQCEILTKWSISFHIDRECLFYTLMSQLHRREETVYLNGRKIGESIFITVSNW